MRRDHLLRQHRAGHAHGVPVRDHGELGPHSLRGNNLVVVTISTYEQYLPSLLIVAIKARQFTLNYLEYS